MLNKKLETILETANDAECRLALKILLQPHTSPVFGAVKAIEHEIAALNALKVLGFISHDADDFDLVENLRITKCKARSLLYQASLREDENDQKIESSLRKILSNPRIVKEGNFYLIEVADPLSMDRLKKKIRTLGFLSDGSFSGSIAKVTEKALLALIDELIPQEQKENIYQELIKAGMADITITGLLKASLSKIGSKIADETGGKIAENIGGYIANIFNEGWETLSHNLKDLK